MTPAVLDRPGTEQLDLDGGMTLEELLNRTLHAARAHGSAECPVCHASMTSTRAGAGDVAVVCGGCGSRLT
jgi:hypothetical protein